MTIFWQNAVAVMVVLASAAYLIWRASRTFRRAKDAGCEQGCSSCPVPKTHEGVQQLVPLTRRGSKRAL